MDNNKPENKNPHKDHRKRLKTLFLKEGLGSFADHNILELLLFFSIPQKDTNEIAHALIDKFGSLSAVFDAKFEELCNVNGISEHSATLIKLIPQISASYSLDKISINADFSDLDYVGKFLVQYYMPKTTECVVAIFLDNNNSAVHIAEISEGVVSMTAVDTRKIAELAFLYNATSFIISHNHPKGSPRASRRDIDTTVDLLHTFEKLGIKLVEHIIVGGEKYKFILKDLSNLKW